MSKKIKEVINSYLTESEKNEYVETIKKRYDFQIKYLDRNIIKENDLKKYSLFYPEEFEKKLLEVVLNENNLVLLSNAGEGKTTELQFLANHFSTQETELFPVLIKLNRYIDENINELIHSEWSEFPGFDALPDKKLLLIFDGYDEIQAKDKNNFSRRIASFCDNHPEVHIVISSRTNFYTNPNQTYSGTLTNFKIYLFIKTKI